MIKPKSNHIYSSLAIISKLINSFLILKILSLILTSNELIDYLIFLNSSNVLQFIFSLGLLTGIIAEAKNENIFSDFALIILLSLISLIILLSANYIYDFTKPIIIFTSLFISLKLLSFSILNGENKKKDFIFYCTLDSLILIMLVFLFNSSFISNGYIYAYFFSSAITFFLFVYKSRKIIFYELIHINSFKILTQFYYKYKNYFYMSFFSAFIVPIANLYIREYISNYSTNELDIATILAGWRLNESFLMVVGTVSSIYFIQKFSAIDDKKNQLDSIRKNSFYFFLLTLSLPLLTLLIPNIIIWLFLNENYVSGYITISIIFLSFSFRAYAYVLGLHLVINKKVLYFIYVEIAQLLTLIIYIKTMPNNQILAIPVGFLLQSLVALTMTRYFMQHKAM